ncbi:glycine cleavage system protein H [Acidihalobacter prosperus]|uniref:Glycine cleavage system protein H n=1 Tax=Acidihalobacter prosperus TaxID=160660 RepID=A0A1A6C8F8_9GAMM|nr:glycine cleavage system protein H [Acidihalobacter prosperus]OBS10853.1 glycine cleavage system protein H [Acidihalobacter prosperus]
MSTYRGCELPEDLYYDLDYVWVRVEADGSLTVGITDPAQTFAGRILRARIKKPGTRIAAGRHVATLESGKWAGGVPIPFEATVIERNEEVLEDGHLINIDPYRDAWVARLQPTEGAEIALSALHTGATAENALKAWIERYDIQCLRCSD